MLATAPNQVRSWEVTKLRARRAWTYYYLYVLLDVYSRYVAGCGSEPHPEKVFLADGSRPEGRPGGTSRQNRGLVYDSTTPVLPSRCIADAER